MRRLVTALLIAVLAGGVAAVAIASGERESRSGAHQRVSGDRDGIRAHKGHARLHGFFARVVLRSLAQRLGVEPRALRRALREIGREQWRKRLDAAGLTAAERAALLRCRRGFRRHHGLRARSSRGRAGCDRAAARSAIQKLRAAPPPELAALKAELSNALATRLGVPVAKVLEGVRAELVQRLDQAVRIGLISARGRELALGCFDNPAGCDLKALRAEVRVGHFRRHRR